MRSTTFLAALVLLGCSCARVRPVQFRPPTSVPSGFVWGYGVEKIQRHPERARQTAYLKAIDDLLAHGPVIATRSVIDSTSVTDAKAVNRSYSSTFRLNAARIIQPGFLRTGIEDGYAWAVVGMTDAEVEQGWQQFLEWRDQRQLRAELLYRESRTSPDPLPLLETAMAILDEIAAQDDPSLLYYEVKSAYAAETARQTVLRTVRGRVDALRRSGQLAAAEQGLNQALGLGLSPESYSELHGEVMQQRKDALAAIRAGDESFGRGQYKESLDRYREARRLDRDNPEISAKVATAESHHRAARAETLRAAASSVGWGATQVLGEYLRWKREEAGNRDERRERPEKKEKEKEKDKTRTTALPAAAPTSGAEVPVEDFPTTTPPAEEEKPKVETLEEKEPEQGREKKKKRPVPGR